jgi:hypothetical protein
MPTPYVSIDVVVALDGEYSPLVGHALAHELHGEPDRAATGLTVDDTRTSR